MKCFIASLKMGGTGNSFEQTQLFRVGTVQVLRVLDNDSRTIDNRTNQQVPDLTNVESRRFSSNVFSYRLPCDA